MSGLPSATVLIASKSGRLGNRLFQSAHFMGSALSHGYNLLNPSLGEYAPLLDGSRRDPLCGTPPVFACRDSDLAAQFRSGAVCLAEVLARTATAFPNGITHRVRMLDIGGGDDASGESCDLGSSSYLDLIRAGGLLVVRGWGFSDHPNLARFRSRIIGYHAPVEEIASTARSIVDRARESSGIVIGVHIRQEDYRFWKGGVHYHEVADYARWMRECSVIWSDSNPSFLICASNEIDHSPFKGLQIIKGPGSPLGDLHALSLCDKIIGPPSTFSQWASYSGSVPLSVVGSGDSVVTAESFRCHPGCTGLTG